jgi:hypothetical protein
MSGLFNALSSSNTGLKIISNGDTVEVALGTYKCNESGSNCAGDDYYNDDYDMLSLNDLYGSIKCASDSADCVIDGESSKRVLHVSGTSGAILTLRALTFLNGQASNGGGAFLTGENSYVNIVLCRFQGCRATGSLGGGAMYVSEGSFDIYVSQFIGNFGDSGDSGGDISAYCYMCTGEITIHNTCPSPYASNNATEGEMRTILSIFLLITKH